MGQMAPRSGTTDHKLGHQSPPDESEIVDRGTHHAHAGQMASLLYVAGRAKRCGEEPPHGSISRFHTASRHHHSSAADGPARLSHHGSMRVSQVVATVEEHIRRRRCCDRAQTGRPNRGRRSPRSARGRRRGYRRRSGQRRPTAGRRSSRRRRQDRRAPRSSGSFAQETRRTGDGGCRAAGVSAPVASGPAGAS